MGSASDHHKLLEEAVSKSLGDLDNAILTLSSAAFVISVTFSSRSNPAGRAVIDAHLASSAWRNLTVAIAITLAGFAVSAAVNHRGAWLVSKGREIPDSLYIWTNWINWALTGIALIAMVRGLYLLSLFATANIT